MFSETFQNVTIGETMEKAVGQAASIMLREVGTSHGVGFGLPVEKVVHAPDHQTLIPPS